MISHYSYVALAGRLTSVDGTKQTKDDIWVLFTINKYIKCVISGKAAQQVEILDKNSMLFVEGEIALCQSKFMVIKVNNLELYSNQEKVDVDEMLKNLKVPYTAF